jgi:galactosyl transferase GMA12/MNN10 family
MKFSLVLLLACTALLICTPASCGRIRPGLARPVGLQLHQEDNSTSAVGSSSPPAAAGTSAASTGAADSAAIAASSSSTTTIGGSACKHPQGVALLTLAHVSVNTSPRMAYLYWLSVVSKRLYAHAQGYPLYVVSSALQVERHPPWSKLIALEAVLAHSCAEWVWITDADSWIMSTGFDAAAFAEHHASLHANATGVQPDLLLAHDCNGINSGSMFVRNTAWARQHLADLWFTNGPEVPNLAMWWEQAALMYLSKQPGVAVHYARVPQVLINAYDSHGTCSDGSGDFIPGTSHLLHAPGNFKDALAPDSEILAPVLESARLPLLQRHNTSVYAVRLHNASLEGNYRSRKEPAGGGSGAAADQQQQAHHQHTTHDHDRLVPGSAGRTVLQQVVFSRSAGAGPSADAVDLVMFEIEVQLRPPHAHNPAWPVSPLQWVHNLVRTWSVFAHADPVAGQQHTRWRGKLPGWLRELVI